MPSQIPGRNAWLDREFRPYFTFLLSPARHEFCLKATTHTRGRKKRFVGTPFVERDSQGNERLENCCRPPYIVERLYYAKAGKVIKKSLDFGKTSVKRLRTKRYGREVRHEF